MKVVVEGIIVESKEPRIREKGCLLTSTHVILLLR
jgi:hypothetical protein